MIDFDSSITAADIPSLVEAEPSDREKVEVAYWARVAVGVPYTIGGVDETFQIRETDKSNWLTFRGVCMEMAQAGQGGAVAPLAMRATSNASYAVTANDGLAATGAIRTYAAALLGRYWALKDAVDAGESFDVSAGWP
ncbi:MAG: hypothetical protein JWR59_602 [Brevundimonas sp.]|nr:hypothetical protein [Brevundimonas sp.]